MSVTSIEWTKRPGTIGEVWNPVTGCNKVDRGCKNCYAEIMHKRLRAMGQKKYSEPFLHGAVVHNEMVGTPFTWTKPRTVFVNSMSDLFHKDVPFNFTIGIFNVMTATPAHTYLILTKRPERAFEFWEWMEAATAGAWECPPNVWMGTSANDQESAGKRIPILLKLQCGIRFLSYEPATGPIDITNGALKNAYSVPTRYDDRGHGIEWTDPGPAFIGLDWVICGGESGPKADPMHPDWARKVRDDCKNAGVPFFFKQWGTYLPHCQIFNTDAPNVPAEAMRSFPSPHNPNKTNIYYKLGKHAAGHSIDGVTIQEFPNV